MVIIENFVVTNSYFKKNQISHINNLIKLKVLKGLSSNQHKETKDKVQSLNS